MHWSHRSLPELKGIPDDEAKRLFRDASKTAQKRMGIWKTLRLPCLICAIAVVCFGVAGGVLGLPWLPSLGAGLGGGLAGFCYAQQIMEGTREVLREMGH